MHGLYDPVPFLLGLLRTRGMNDLNRFKVLRLSYEVHPGPFLSKLRMMSDGPFGYEVEVHADVMVSLRSFEELRVEAETELVAELVWELRLHLREQLLDTGASSWLPLRRVIFIV